MNLHVDADGAVDIRAHVGHAHEHLRGLADPRLQLLVVNHIMKLWVVVEDDRGAGCRRDQNLLPVLGFENNPDYPEYKFSIKPCQ